MISHQLFVQVDMSSVCISSVHCLGTAARAELRASWLSVQLGGGGKVCTLCAMAAQGSTPETPRVFEFLAVPKDDEEVSNAASDAYGNLKWCSQEKDEMPRKIGRPTKICCSSWAS